jgi:hypothetical protein
MRHHRGEFFADSVVYRLCGFQRPVGTYKDGRMRARKRRTANTPELPASGKKWDVHTRLS